MNFDIGDGVMVAVVLGLILYFGSVEDHQKVQVSCNNLKAAAIAASQPVPECAK